MLGTYAGSVSEDLELCLLELSCQGSYEIVEMLPLSHSLYEVLSAGCHAYVILLYCIEYLGVLLGVKLQGSDLELAEAHAHGCCHVAFCWSWSCRG